jgi:hypothetical protein
MAIRTAGLVLNPCMELMDAAGHVVRLVAEQEDDHARDFLRAADSPHRNPLEDLLLREGARRREQSRVDCAGAHAVAAEALRPYSTATARVNASAGRFVAA